MYDFQTVELSEIKTDSGESLADLSQNRAVLLVFLRHFGCTFCREALVDISEKREDIEAKGVKIVFVHMSNKETAEEYFNQFSLKGVAHICDPECDLYQQFGLVKGNFRQLFGLNTWIRGFEVGVMKGMGIGKTIGDGFQMPGAFIIRNGEIREQYIHKNASDKLDYNEFSQCCIT